MGTLLRVMTFNIRYGTARDRSNHWDNRRDAVVRVIQDAAPHLLGLQEALMFQNRHIEQHLPYHFTGVGRDDSVEAGEFASLFYGEPLGLQHAHTFWFSDTPGVPSRTWGNSNHRICTHARLCHHGWGRTIHAFNVHLGSSTRVQVRSAELLLSMIEQHAAGQPVVVLGDFNCGPTSKPYRLLRDAGLRDSFSAADLSPLSVTYHGWKGRKRARARFARRDSTRMDWVLHNEQLVASAYRIISEPVEGRYPSDHYPVVAELGLAG